MVVVISVVSEVSANPHSALVGGGLNYLRRFRDSRRFRKSHRCVKHRFGKATV